MINVQDHLVLQSISQNKRIRANNTSVEIHYRSLARFAPGSLLICKYARNFSRRNREYAYVTEKMYIVCSNH